jgi:energy-coupling factor transporter ATP-binding protein EcfA2
MARRESEGKRVNVGNLTNVSGEVNIAAGDIGYTSQQVSDLLTQITSTFEPKKFRGRCPYKGLDYFEESDAKTFFGREQVIEDLVTRLKDSRVIFITGPSGSGKSSLVRAGLIPALKNGAILGSEEWLYATMKPGRAPVSELARAASQLAGSARAEKEICDEALEDPTIFSRWCEIVLGSGDEKRAIVFIDQFEEIFTQTTIGETERIAFLKLLTYAGTAQKGRITLLLALRSDFISNCAAYPELNALLSRQLIQIGAMQPHELVGSIALPALHVGLRIDPDLIAQIINDMRNEPGALPLMQFALKDLFDAHKEKDGIHALTLDGYIEQGGIYKALERHADKSFEKLTENEKKLAQFIFSSLVEIGHGTPDTRRTSLFDEIPTLNAKPEEMLVTVRKLADARLITTDKQAGKDTLTLIHEKLIEAWPWLKKLVNENRDVIALQNELTADANEWEEHERDKSYLYSGVRLANVDEQLKSGKLVLSRAIIQYIEAGQARQQNEQRIRILGVVGVVTLIAAGVLLFFIITTTNASKLAEQSQRYANTQAVIASTSQANAATAQAANALAVSNEQKAKEQAIESLARQLAAQAQSIMASQNAKQNIAVLLSVLSMQMFPTVDAGQVLQKNNLASPIASMTHESLVNAVAFSPDGKYVVSGSGDKTARVWESTTGREVARMTHESLVNTVAFSPDSKYVVSGSGDNTARVWEATTGREVARMNHDDFVYAVAFSPDGRYVVSGSWDKTARVWEAATGREIARMTHNNLVNSVAFSLDGKYVVSGSEDTTARVWDAITGQEVARMTHEDAVSSVAFSPDGRYVVSGSYDKTARVWEAATGVSKESIRE